MISALRSFDGVLSAAAMLLSGALLACPQISFAQGCSTTAGAVSVPRKHHTLSVAELRIPEKAWEHFHKAGEATDRKQFDREADKALAVAPDFIDVYVLRAARQLHDGDSEAALATISAARRLQADVPWSSILVAGALTHQHRFDEAVAELDRARGAELSSWQWKFERARAEIGRRSVQGSLRWSAQAMAAVPGDCSEVHLLRLDALMIAGQKQEALAEMETYMRLDGRPAVREQVTRLLAETRAELQKTARGTGQPDAAQVAGVEPPATP